MIYFIVKSQGIKIDEIPALSYEDGVSVFNNFFGDKSSCTLHSEDGELIEL